MGRRGGDVVQSRSTPHGSMTHRWEANHNCRGSSKERGVWAPYWALQPGGPALGRQAARTLGASRACFWETQRAVGNRDCTLKVAHKISHALRPRVEAVIWRELGSDPFVDLRDPLREAGGNWESPVEHRYWWQPLWGVFSTMRTLGLASSVLESSL